MLNLCRCASEMGNNDVVHVNYWLYYVSQIDYVS